MTKEVIWSWGLILNFKKPGPKYMNLGLYLNLKKPGAYAKREMDLGYNLTLKCLMLKVRRYGPGPNPSSGSGLSLMKHICGLHQSLSMKDPGPNPRKVGS